MRYRNIIIDCGHGGLLPNGKYTTAPYKMYKHTNGETAYEGVINRQIGRKLESLFLEFTTLNIEFTVNPKNPKDVSLKDRVKFANKFNPKETLFVSIHSNASRNHEASGFEIWTFKGKTYADVVANYIKNNITPLLNTVHKKFRGVKKRTEKQRDLYVLRNTRCPALLIECLFFDYQDDFKYLKDDTFLDEMVLGIYKGIVSAI